MKKRTIYSWSMALGVAALIGLFGPSASMARPITAPGSIPDYFETPNWANSPSLTKFVDELAPLGCGTPTPTLGQCLPIAVAANYPYNGDANGSDYYEIAIVEYREQMHSELPPLLDSLGNPTTVKTAAYGDPAAAVSGGTLLRGYVQEVNGVPVTQPHYLGPIIVAQKDRPVRIKFINRLPTGTGGDLFVPVDTSIMGSGDYEINYNPATKAILPGTITGTFTQNRAELHLHGGRTPWISDGTPHQWITPAGDADAAQYPKGTGVAYVPDMWYDANNGYAEIVGCRGQNTCGQAGATNNPGPGAQTYYWTNAQSARLMFYHDHAWGLTRLNVYVGEAAGYVIEDTTETALFGQAPLNALAGTLPLIIQDKTFVDPTTIKNTDPTWAWGSTPPSQTFTTNPDGTATPSSGAALTQSGQGMNPVLGDLWWPHVYMPAQNPFNPNLSGISDMGRWHYGPWFFPSTPTCGSTPDAVKPLCVDFGPVNNVYAGVANPGQPPLMPGTPKVSWGAEAFLDTMMVNGTVYPTLNVDPGTYRLRILNASHDRFLNLQIYQAEPMSIAVTNGGSGYATPPAVTISGGGGSGATAEATITGTVTGATIVNGGSGYTAPPTVTIAGAGVGATATATIGNGVNRVYPTNGGSGYTSAPSVTFGGGVCTVDPTAVALIEGYVSGITVTNGGSGYDPANPPVVTIDGGGGIGSEVVSVTVTGDAITAINVTPGVQYTSAPTVTIAPPAAGTPATATADLAGFVTGFMLTSSGTCTAAPTVVLGAPGGGGTQATAKAVYGTGVVNSITITNAGDGYGSGDTFITISGGGGSGATASASVTGSVTGIAVTNPGSGYTSAPTVTVAPGGGVQATATAYLGTEVKMVPAAATAGFPPTWPADGREGGVPDPAYRGPAFIQFATEGGFLPAPVVLNNQPVTWNVDPTMFNVGNVLNQRDGGGTLFVGPAERADVLVDFSQYAGRTLILYNDAPTAFPALDPHYDYYTGAPDRTDIGGSRAIQAGQGPNIRTVMQIKVGPQTYASAPTVNDAVDDAALTTMQTAFAGTTGVFATGQDPIVVGQTAYDGIYCSGGNQFPATYPNWGISRISDGALSFMKPDCSTVVQNLAMKPKAIHDEMGATYDDYGRMSAKLGLEMPFTNAAIANFILQNYVDPSTEIVHPGETQIWRITHNGVDTHPIHFHLFDVQVLNRVGWDGFIRMPDDNELGWKDTVRVSPLEDTIVALKPIKPPVPFGLPFSIRPLNPEAPIGSNMGFSNIDTANGGNLATPTTNTMTNFGYEYVWHCHILSHEENDMMRAMILNPNAKTTILWRNSVNGKDMIWNMNGANHVSVFTSPEPDLNWKIVGRGDFNGDGYSDILWRNTSNGQNRVWTMNEATQLGTVALNPEPDQNWKIVGTGDFNNDSKLDILWWNSSNGQVRAWYMNGTAFGSSASLGSQTNTTWQVVGAADFNSDGRSDIVWRNTSNGKNMIWFMNGVNHTSSFIDPEVDQNWKIVAQGDFNDDVYNDIVWWNSTTGAVRAWYMKGLTLLGTAPFGSQSNTSWQIVGR